MANEQDMDQENFFDDLDASVEDVEDTNEVEQSTAVEEVTSKSENHTVSTNLSSTGLDFSTLANTPGVAVGNTGLKISRFPVERIKFAEKQRALISILSDQVIAVKTHWDDDLGNFLCFGGECCEHDLAHVHYVFPIIRYATDAKGKPIPNTDDNGKPQSPLYEITNMCLSVGQDTYDALSDIQELKGSLTQFDFLVSCSDSKYQKITIQEAGAARYHKDPALEKEIQRFWKENSKHILNSIAKSITPEEYKNKTAADMNASNQVDFDEVFS